MTESTRFQRCDGCPVVSRGEMCHELQSLVGQINFADPDFLRAEVACEKVGKGAMCAREKVTITKEGAAYGLGKAADAVYALFNFD